jgi:hypothetical protein
MNKISIFANFYIPNQERLEKLKISFKSFYKINIENWVINIRGSMKNEAHKYLKRKINRFKVKFFFIESKKGWIHDSLQISNYLKSKLIFFWVEDHVCIGGNKYFNSVIRSANENNVDYIPYSWFFFGNNIKFFKYNNYLNDKNMYFGNYTKIDHKKRLDYVKKNKLACDIFIISCCSIISKKLFIKLLTYKDKFFPKWDKMLPFNFEKTQHDNHWLPYRIGILKQELFASLDDNLCVKNYSLASRGLFKNMKITVKNKTVKKENLNKILYKSRIKYFLKKILNYVSAYIFIISR